MKNFRRDIDGLRPEYTRDDFKNAVRGQSAFLRLEIAEFVRIYIACIGEDEHLKFTKHTGDNALSERKRGDWTYEFDAADQITLRYWFDETGSIEESMSNPTFVTTPQERTALQDLLTKHVQTLKSRVTRSSPR